MRKILAIKDKLNAMFLKNKIPLPHFNYEFHPKRKWLLHLAWPDKLLGVSVEYGLWCSIKDKKHKRQYAKHEKQNEMTRYGWRLLRYEPHELFTTMALEQIHAALQWRCVPVDEHKEQLDENKESGADDGNNALRSAEEEN